MTTRGAGRPPRGMVALSPHIDDRLLDAAATLLAPITQTLGGAELASREGTSVIDSPKQEVARRQVW